MDKARDLEPNTSKLIETNVHAIAQETVTKEAIVNHDGLFELLLVGAVSLAGFYSLYKKSSLYLDRGSRYRKGRLKKFSQPNCINCRFSERNSALKCQLHPVRISEQQKANCTDYWHQNNSKFLHR